MITTNREFSLAVQTTLGFQHCLSLLKRALSREGFRILAEVPFHQELDGGAGVRWQSYTVLVVCNPFHAYQALLSDRDAGIFMPFHFVVAQDGNLTLLAATNVALFGRMAGTIGVQVLARDLTRMIRKIFSELSAHEVQAADPVLQGRGKEAP